MNISTLDQTREKELSFYGEAVRLSNELRAKPARTVINIDGDRVNIPAKQGFDIEICSFMDLVNYLADTRIKKSESMISFIHRVLNWRFETEYDEKKDKIFNRYQLEKEMIQSNSRKEVEFLGESGFQNLVRLDGSLTKKGTRIEKLKGEKIRIKKV